MLVVGIFTDYCCSCKQLNNSFFLFFYSVFLFPFIFFYFFIFYLFFWKISLLYSLPSVLSPSFADLVWSPASTGQVVPIWSPASTGQVVPIWSPASTGQVLLIWSNGVTVLCHGYCRCWVLPIDFVGLWWWLLVFAEILWVCGGAVVDIDFCW